MFDFSILKIILTIMVGLIVLGPKRLAELARTLGKYWKILKRSIDKAKAEFEDLVDEVDIDGSKRKPDKSSAETIQEVDIHLSGKINTSNRDLSSDYRDYDVKPKTKSLNVSEETPVESEVKKENIFDDKALESPKISE